VISSCKWSKIKTHLQQTRNLFIDTDKNNAPIIFVSGTVNLLVIFQLKLMAVEGFT